MTKRKNLLIVDDEPEILDMMTSFFEDEEDFDLLTAKDGEEAVKLVLENQDINIIIMDVMMPKLNGLDACAQIKKNEHAPYIVLYSGLASEEDIKRGYESGCDHYLAKPVDFETLLDLMDKVAST